MAKETAAQTEAAMDLAIHELVDMVDRMGYGVEAMEYMGPEGFKILMDAYRRHEETTRD